MRRRVLPQRLGHVALLLSAATLAALLAGRAQTAESEDSPAEPAPSAYAPAEELVAAVNLSLEDIAKQLEDPEDYTESSATRVALIANSLVAAAQVLDNHDQENPLLLGSSDFIDRAQDLVAASGDYDQAAAAYAALAEQFQQPGTGEPVAWDAVADVSLLMAEVPIVNNNLRRGVGGRRFEREQEKSLALAAMLASMAQAARYDLNYTFDDEEAAQWQQICDQMRDATAAVAEAVRQGDQETAKAGLDRIVETCDACHHQFRD